MSLWINDAINRTTKRRFLLAFLVYLLWNHVESDCHRYLADKDCSNSDNDDDEWYWQALSSSSRILVGVVSLRQMSSIKSSMDYLEHSRWHQLGEQIRTQREITCEEHKDYVRAERCLRMWKMSNRQERRALLPFMTPSFLRLERSNSDE